MGKITRPGDPIIVKRREWMIWLKMRWSKMIIFRVGKVRQFQRWVCRRIGHKKNGYVTEIPQVIGKPKKFIICPRCGRYEDFDSAGAKPMPVPDQSEQMPRR